MSSQELVLFCSYIKRGYYGTLFWHLPKLMFILTNDGALLIFGALLIEDRATCQFEARKMKSPNWCIHPGFCRIPQPSKWEIDLRSSLYKSVGVSGTCAKTHNKFIKPPSTLYPETTVKIWSQLTQVFFFLERPPQVKDQIYPLTPSYPNIFLHIC